VIAAFAVDKGLIDKDLYSSIVLAILLSTIIAPFSLRFTISYFNKKAMAEVLRAEEEMNLKGVDDVLTVCFELHVCIPCHDHVYYTRCTNRFFFFCFVSTQTGILEGTTLFYCINTTSHAAWGTLPALMKSLMELELEVIDHRSWHSRFESTVVNEVYVKGLLRKDDTAAYQLELIEQKVKDSINQTVSSNIIIE
jgi:hypothetical protein